MHKATRIQKNFGKLFDLKLIGILVIVVFFMTVPAFAFTPPDRHLILSPHTSNHLVGENVAIPGLYVDGTDHFIQEYITIKIFDMDGSNVNELYFSKINAENGRFSDKRFSPNQTGNYLVYAESTSGTIGKVSFQVVNFYETFAFLILIVLVISFGLLMCIMAFIGHKIITVPLYHVSRFSLITIIVFCMLSFFIVSNVEYGTNSAIGIIFTDQIAPEDKSDAIALGLPAPLKLDWVLKFGGNYNNDKPSGLEIPLYILIFGVLGGYLRFFYFTANPWLRKEILKRLDETTEKYFVHKMGDGLPSETNDVVIDEKSEEGEITISTKIKNVKYKIIMHEAYAGKFYPVLSVVLTNRLMSDLSLLLIAPVLAVMLFFVLSQSGLNLAENVLTFAVTSFTAGLFTEDVIKKLKPGSKKDDQPESSDETNDEKAANNPQ